MAITFANIGAPEVLIVLGVVVLIFGGSQLPKLARSLGSAKREFEKGQRGETPSGDDSAGAGRKS